MHRKGLHKKLNLYQDGVDQRMMESLSLIDAVMPDIVATRQQALQQQTQQSGTVTKGPAGLIKQEQESNGDDSNKVLLGNMLRLIYYCALFQIQPRLVSPFPPVTTTHQIYLAVFPPSQWMLTAVLRFPLVKPPFCEGTSLKFLFVRGTPHKTSLPPGKTN